MSSKRERQIERLRNELPCPGCGHPSSRLGEHDCDSLLSQSQPREVLLSDDPNFLEALTAPFSSGAIAGVNAKWSAVTQAAKNAQASMEKWQAAQLTALSRAPHRQVGDRIRQLGAEYEWDGNHWILLP